MNTTIKLTPNKIIELIQGETKKEIMQHTSIDQAVSKTDNVEKPQPAAITSLPEVTEENWQDHIELASISPSKAYTESNHGIDRIEKDGRINKIVPSEALTVITGKPKVGKSRQAYLFTSISLQPNIYNQLFATSFDKDKNEIIYADTEQSLGDNRNAYKIIQSLTGNKGEITNFRLLALRNYNYKERIFLLGKHLYKNRRVSMLIIDGIRDLVSDPNSAEESNNVVSLLLKWATELQIAIIVIIHQNKINNEIRGHLGTEIVNKAHTVVVIEKDGDCFVVSPVLTRLRTFSPWGFKIGDDGVPEIIKDFEKESASTKNKFVPEEESIEYHQ